MLIVDDVLTMCWPRAVQPRPWRIWCARAEPAWPACMLMELDARNGHQALGGIPLSVLLHV